MFFFAGQLSAPMPVAVNVDQLSDDSGVDAPKEPPEPSPKVKPPRKGRSAKEKAAAKLEKASPEHLRSLLNRICPCKKRTCNSQFAENSKYVALKDYLSHWHDLHKLDQDNFVLGLFKGF